MLDTFVPGGRGGGRMLDTFVLGGRGGGGYVTSWTADDRAYYTGVGYTRTEVRHIFGANFLLYIYIYIYIYQQLQSLPFNLNEKIYIYK